VVVRVWLRRGGWFRRIFCWLRISKKEKDGGIAPSAHRGGFPPPRVIFDFPTFRFFHFSRGQKKSLPYILRHEWSNHTEKVKQGHLGVVTGSFWPGVIEDKTRAMNLRAKLRPIFSLPDDRKFKSPA
jgi:hypothetical protein